MPPSLSRRFHCSGMLDQASNLSLGQPAQQQLQACSPFTVCQPSHHAISSGIPTSRTYELSTTYPPFPSCKPSKPAGSHVAKHHTVGQLQTLISRNLKYVFIRPPPLVFLLQPRFSGPSTIPPLSSQPPLRISITVVLPYGTIGSHIGAHRIASPRQGPGRERVLLWHPSPTMLTASHHKSAPFDRYPSAVLHSTDRSFHLTEE